MARFNVEAQVGFPMRGYRLVKKAIMAEGSAYSNGKVYCSSIDKKPQGEGRQYDYTEMKNDKAT
jgi:hypothetical protein